MLDLPLLRRVECDRGKVMAVDANEDKADKAMDYVNRWREGSKPMGPDEFEATVKRLIEKLEEAAVGDDGFEWP